jgi:electron transfer flavoprotein alpha subunit
MSQDIYVLIEHFKGHVSDISYMMLGQARELAKANGGKVIAVLLGHNAGSLAQDLAADNVLVYDHPALAAFTWDAYLKVLTGLLQAEQPRLFIMGETTIGSDAAAGLSARVGLPLIGFCVRMRSEAGAIKYTSSICGGKLAAEGELPSGTVLATMQPGALKAELGKSSTPPPLTQMAVPPLEGLRVRMRQFIEPETSDVDITKETVLVSVGRGIQNKDNIDLAQELADALGCAVAASRPVTDQGWLPTTRLVGKSGKAVKPKVYLALGISGAPEHTEALAGAELIVAVNTDPVAPIFNVAKYGSTVDLLDLLPALTEQVLQAKGG